MILESSLSSVGEAGFAIPGTRTYSRAFIPGDQEVAPCELTGTRRKVFLAFYGAIVVSAITGLAYTFYFNPLFGLTALVVGYCFDNLAFTCGHVGFHAEFIDSSEGKMKTLSHHAFIHHYRNIRVFHETWLETRMSYFVDPRTVVTAKSCVKFLAIALVFFPVIYFVHPVLGIAIYSAQAVPLLLQSTVHEWYHNPPNNRASFYSPPVYWFFTLLEKLSIASTRDHMVHHRHGLNDLDHVHKWLDLRLPFGELMPSLLWRKALSVYEPGESRMTEFARRGAPFKLFVGSRVLATVTIAAAYYWIARSH